jgi:hypothetical protein
MVGAGTLGNIKLKDNLCTFVEKERFGFVVHYRLVYEEKKDPYKEQVIEEDKKYLNIAYIALIGLDQNLRAIKPIGTLLVIDYWSLDSLNKTKECFRTILFDKDLDFKFESGRISRIKFDIYGNTIEEKSVYISEQSLVEMNKDFPKLKKKLQSRMIELHPFSG